MPDRDPNFVATIYARNQLFTAWESVMVQRTFGTGVSTFQLTPAEGYYGQRMLGLQIAPGDPVTIALAGQLAFTGYCMTRAGAYDAKSHQVVIAGVSRTYDLAGSSAVVQPGSFDGSSFQQAARAVMAPHPVSLVIANPPDGASQPFKNLAIQYGETCAEFISRIAAARNMFVTDDASGNLVVGHAAPDLPSSVTLVEGRNIKRCSFKINDPSAYSWSKFRAASQTKATDEDWPTRGIAALASYATPRPNTYRLMIASQADDSQGLVSGLTHEAIRSAWPEIEIDVTVAGWLRPDGKLWAPAPDGGCKVSFFSPLALPNATGMAFLGIAGVHFTQDSENGTETTLTLRRWELLTHSKTGDVRDAGSTGAVPSVAPDAPDWT